jgi:hypothetical protein
MSKKLLSTILLFAVGIGFLWFGLHSLIAAIQTPDAYQTENIIFSLIYLGVAIYAFGAIFALPHKSKG